MNDPEIEKAFRTLRQNGYFARQNWACCQSCGISELPAGTKNYVFYHNQDADDLREYGRVYLSWHGDADFICSILRAAGLTVHYAGDDRVRILVEIPKATVH